MLYLIASALCVGVAAGLIHYLNYGFGFCKEWQDAVATGAVAFLFMLAFATFILGVLSFCAK